MSKFVSYLIGRLMALFGATKLDILRIALMAAAGRLLLWMNTTDIIKAHGLDGPTWFGAQVCLVMGTALIMRRVWAPGISLHALYGIIMAGAKHNEKQADLAIVNSPHAERAQWVELAASIMFCGFLAFCFGIAGLMVWLLK